MSSQTANSTCWKQCWVDRNTISINYYGIILVIYYINLNICLKIPIILQKYWLPCYLCGLVVRVPGYRSRGPSLIQALSDFLRSSGSGTRYTQPHEYNCGATWKKK
jgi:hypothetical protein